MNLTQANLTIMPKDCAIKGIPKLSCDSGMKPLAESDLSLGMAYIPYQQFKELYDHNYALEVGTIFKELDLPFYGIGGSLL